jgi:hypothetical protein
MEIGASYQLFGWNCQAGVPGYGYLGGGGSLG